MNPFEHHSLSKIVERYKRDGFYIIKKCVNGTDLKIMSDYLTNKWQAYFQKEGYKKPHTKLELHGDTLLISPAFRKLALNDHLLKLATLLQGDDIQINYFGAQINPKQKPEKNGMSIHRDGGELYENLGYPFPDLGVKFALWLTDGMELNRGNFIVIPGTQYREVESNNDETYSLKIEAGDVIMFDPRMLHGRGPNHSDIIRQVIFMEYGPRWLEPKWNNSNLLTIKSNLRPIEFQLYSLFDDPWRSFAPRWIEKPLHRHLNKD
ncbi:MULTISPECIES: phytanoyl-CoA dioxygenase family protein [Photorhabdus]|uniref:Phytanoyl-CoA dioxygenase family protein n=1 Tax=Photorhabdus bodei TaxID=2029681 RepID=A0AAW6BIX9_9GAMM|nr:MULTISPECIES: phytanoyl-CoA dioxygenase family protein [Photorhabdus]MCT8351793.1 phytanoyl-CoA dioxygenase family protein [Photorhabdus kayaii]MDB6373468.1 phytanoyl-CoA dioxygenase family protein [Photorhabdus bodei]